jgi:hypothetical protein
MLHAQQQRHQVIREELLPTVIESWNTLSDEAQKEISNMGNYFFNENYIHS